MVAPLMPAWTAWNSFQGTVSGEALAVTLKQAGRSNLVGLPIS